VPARLRGCRRTRPTLALPWQLSTSDC
jgi:hypothetical protein